MRITILSTSSSRSVWITSRTRFRSDSPILIKRSSVIECSSSEKVTRSGSLNTLLASSKSILCFSRLTRAFLASHSITISLHLLYCFLNQKPHPSGHGLSLITVYCYTVLGGALNFSISATTSASGWISAVFFFLPKPNVSNTSLRLSSWMPRAGSTPLGQACEQAPAM